MVVLCQTKGSGQQVDVPHQLLLFMALHTEKSVVQNNIDPGLSVRVKKYVALLSLN